jgi:multidrug efflux pump subunit AcrA (membrane-fusion protein)
MNSLPCRHCRFLHLFLLLSGLWIAGCSKGSPAVSEEEQSDLPTEPVPVLATLVAVPERIAVISPQVGGWVEKVHVVDGQLVHAGDVLVTLDSRIAQVDVERSRAAVVEKQAVLARLKRGYLPQELEVAGQDRDKAQAMMEGLRAELEALRELASRNEISKVQLETKAKAFEAAKAAFASAEAHLKLLEEGTPPEMIAEAEAQLDSAKAGLDHAQLLVELCSITSPIDGIVTNLLARQGQFFNQASPLATITDLSEIFVHLRIPSEQFAHVPEKTFVDISPISFPGRTFSGQIVRVNGEADPLTGNIDAFAVVANENALLRPGLGCRARVWLTEIPDALAVPATAIADHAGTAVVTVVRDDRAYEVDVMLGARTVDSVQVVKGLSAGDTVITAGGYGLPEGCPVKIVSDLGVQTAGTR